jgi:hypothetical protein
MEADPELSRIAGWRNREKEKEKEKLKETSISVVSD